MNDHILNEILSLLWPFVWMFIGIEIISKFQLKSVLKLENSKCIDNQKLSFFKFYNKILSIMRRFDGQLVLKISWSFDTPFDGIETIANRRFIQNWKNTTRKMASLEASLKFLSSKHQNNLVEGMISKMNLFSTWSFNNSWQYWPFFEIIFFKSKCLPLFWG